MSIYYPARCKLGSYMSVARAHAVLSGHCNIYIPYPIPIFFLRMYVDCCILILQVTVENFLRVLTGQFFIYSNIEEKVWIPRLL